MFIYVSGPYSPANSETDPDARKKSIAENIEKANKVALEIVKKGHVPFVPHTMMAGWEDVHGLPREQALDICHKWVQKCDALYFIASSPGADSERHLAEMYGMPIFLTLDEIDKESSKELLTQQALQAYLMEYHQCMESYRHTYATIWQAGAMFAAISAAVITLSASQSFSNVPLLQVVAPLPILFWYIGIFIPMNGYGEKRNDRLVDIEKLLSARVPGLQMRHFTDYSEGRKGDRERTDETKKGRRRLLGFIPIPRVIEVVTLLAIALLILEGFLIYWHYGSKLSALLPR